MTYPSFRFARRLVVSGAALLAATAIAGSIYQQASRQADLREIGPAGRIFTVSGAVMHLDCRGEGETTLLLEAGATGFAGSWTRIQEDLAIDVRVCSYDRAGLGWSDTASGDADAETTAARLRELLDEAGEQGPFVLAGHSLGGPLALTFAAQNPEQVDGLILIDPSHPDQLDRFSPEIVDAFEGFRGMIPVAARLAPTGLLRLTNVFGRNASDLPERAYREAVRFGSDSRHLRQSGRELEAWDRTMDSARNALGHLDPGLPVLVLSAEIWEGPDPELAIETQLAMHREYAARFDNGRHVVIPGSDHFSIIMNRDHAGLTAAEIRRFLSERRFD